MLISRSGAALLAACALITAVAVAQNTRTPAPMAPPTASGPAAAGEANDIPRPMIDEIDAQFIRPRQPMTEAQLVKVLTERMEKVLELARAAEEKYPQAANLPLVRDRALRAASLLAQGDADKYGPALLSLAQRIVQSKAPEDAKVQADFILTTEKIKPTQKSLSPATPAAAEKEIRDYVARYDKTKAAPAAIAYGATMAREAGNQQKLLDELTAVLQQKYADNPHITRFLLSLGKHRDVGKPFDATLTRLDGQTLTLPRDLKGKVVVVHFWASSSASCRAEIAQMKKLYQKYKDQGLEFVGVSWDKAREDAESYVKEQQIGWIMTHSAKAGDDTAALKYGVQAIPMKFILSRDGTIVAGGSIDDIEPMILQTLKAPATAPAGKE